MKNETISRIILVLEIAAIILFHSLKSNSTAEEKIVRDIASPAPTNLQQAAHFAVTGSK